MERHFTKLEDRLLVTHFNRLMDAIIKDASASRKPDTSVQILEEAGGINWRSFRVPEAMRHDFLVRQYVTRLLQNQKQSKEVYRVFLRSFQEQAEVLAFLRSL